MQLTTSYQLISSFNLTYGAMRTYAKYSAQSSTDNTTTYQLKQVYYCSVSGGYVGFDYGVGVLDGTQKVYNGYTRMYFGETTIQEFSRVIEHNPDGSSPTKNVATSWSASAGGGGNTNVDITFPNIARYPILTNATDFNDEGQPTIYFTNALGFPGATVRTILADADTGVQIPGIEWEYITNVASGSFTYSLTDAEKNTLRTWCSTSKSKQLYFALLTEYNGTQYWSPSILKTYTVINANPTFNVAYKDTNATTTAITGDNQKIIQTHSTFQLNITNASAKKSASLSSVHTEIMGYSSTVSISSATKNITVGSVNASSNTVAKVTLTDSRGYSTQIDLPVTILSYSLPNAIIDLKRKQNYYTETDITPDATFSSLDGNNTLTIQYRTKKKSEENYGAYASLTNNTTTTFNADNTYAWDIQVLLTDRIGSTTYNLSLGVGLPIFFIDRLKQSIGINCFPNGDKTIEIDNKDISNTYSTSELKVGTWIDGKPIYRKAGTGTSAVGNVSINMGLSNIDTITSYKGVYNSTYPIPYATDTAGFTIETYRNGTDIVVRFGSNITANKPFLIVVEYTKTTD